MRSPTLVHPYLLGELAIDFDQIIGIQRATETIGDRGEISEAWADLPGHDEIPAAIDPVVSAGEIKGAPRTVVIGAWQMLLLGVYPAIRAKDRAIWQGRTLDIQGAYTAPHSVYTFLSAREVA